MHTHNINNITYRHRNGDHRHNCHHHRHQHCHHRNMRVGNVTVPVLFDTKTQKIVSNSSESIMRNLNDAFNALATDASDADAGGVPLDDFYPAELRDAIDEVNAFVYPVVNNGVYKAGFAQSQAVYVQYPPPPPPHTPSQLPHNKAQILPRQLRLLLSAMACV
jgi:glutathionyl-hydroquinone reductase